MASSAVTEAGIRTEERWRWTRPGGPATFHDARPHRRCGDRPVQRPRVRRGECRRRRARRGASPAGRCSAITPRRTRSCGATSTRISNTSAICSTMSIPTFTARRVALSPVGVQHLRRGGGRTAPEPDAGDPGDRRAAGVLDDDVRGLAGRDRPLRRDEVRGQDRRPGPQTTAWAMLGVALSAYEHWLADESVSLHDALAASFDVVGTRTRRPPLARCPGEPASWGPPRAGVRGELGVPGERACCPAATPSHAYFSAHSMRVGQSRSELSTAGHCAEGPHATRQATITGVDEQSTDCWQPRTVWRPPASYSPA